MNILFATPVLPGARTMGGLVFSQSVIDRLRCEGARVRIVGWHEAGAPPPPDADAASAGPRALVTRRHPVAALGWAARALVRGEPLSVAKFRDPRLDALVAAEAARADLVVIDHEMAWIADHVPAGIPIVHLSHQIASRIHVSRGPVARRERRLLARDEARLAARCTQVWTIAPDDAAAYRVAGADARHLPWTPDAPPPPDPARPGDGVAMLGNWDWEPNRRGLRWFVDAVLPHLGVPVTLGGRGAARWAGSGLRIAAPVADDMAFLRAARVVAIPSTGGVGLQTKTLVAMAAGRAIVATPHALRHIDERPDGLVATGDPAAFAAAIEAAVHRPPPPWGDALALRRARYHAAVRDALAALRGWDDRAT